MRMLRRLTKRFAKGEDGYMIIEATLMLPFLFWGYLALYSYWDAYRVLTDVQKAAYSISDLITRQQTPVNAGFITGMRRTMDSMLGVGLETELRVTSVVWVQARNRYEVLWSRVSGTSRPVLATQDLVPLRPRIPEMFDGDTVVIVETWVDYEPAMTLGGVGDMTFDEFIVTRPRFVPSVIFQ